MNTKDTGGPAFPSSFPLPSGGISLRDYFAIQALAPLINQIYADKSPKNQAMLVDGGSSVAEMLSKVAYLYADKMLAERSK